jgi:hypothetical protein
MSVIFCVTERLSQHHEKETSMDAIEAMETCSAARYLKPDPV